MTGIGFILYLLFLLLLLFHFFFLSSSFSLFFIRDGILHASFTSFTFDLLLVLPIALPFSAGIRSHMVIFDPVFSCTGLPVSPKIGSLLTAVPLPQ